MRSDLDLAFRLADLADAETMSWWSPTGVASSSKADGTPVADVAAEQAVLSAIRAAHPGDGSLGEEVGGRFSDLQGGRRLDTRTAIYSNCSHHDEVLAALAGR